MNFTTTNGAVIDSADITFNPNTYHVYWDLGTGLAPVDITYVMKQADKRNLIPGFDPQMDSLRASNEARGVGGPIAPTSGTSTLGNLWNQLTTDPLSAPIESAESAIKKAGQTLSKSTGIQTVIVLGLVGLGLYLVLSRRK